MTKAKHKRVALEVSLAISEAVKLLDVDVISAYPITPQTHIVEGLAEMVNNGELDAEFIPVESEHTAMSACVGAAAVGARAFTATNSQGLALMSEILYIASGLRLPIVMVVVNRSLSAPLSIWGDHSDIMANRDIGWIQFFAENGQEALDLVVIAYRVAEDERVVLPAVINIDGFTLSHVIEPVLVPDQRSVLEFAPHRVHQITMDPDKPVMMGPVGIPEIYTEAKKAQNVALVSSRAVIDEAFDEFGRVFGRRYRAVESYRADGAEIVLVTMGGISETAMTAVDRMRRRGQKVGLIRLRVWRPFPFEDIRDALLEARAVAVLDRALSFGGCGGPVASEIRSALYNTKAKRKPPVYSFIGALSGRDFTSDEFVRLVDRVRDYARRGILPEYEMVGVRE